MRNMKAIELILDFGLYPRNDLDPVNIRGLVEALESEIEIPPIVIDRKSKRVVDGFHRVRAYLQFGGDEVEIPVVEKNYKDDAAMFLDAMRYNASHGAKLDTADRVHCTIIAERLHIPAESVAGALHISVDKVGELSGRIATCGGQPIALTRTLSHMAGKRLTKAQREANERSSGMNPQFYVNQVIDLLENDLLDRSNPKLMDRLAVLGKLLRKVLAAAAA
jgi:hypothetical protein